MTKRPLRGALRGFLFLALTGILVLVYLPAMALGKRATLAVRWLWCRGSARILGVRASTVRASFRRLPDGLRGKPRQLPRRSGARRPADGTFIAKSEIASWPLFGLLCRLTGTLFVRRHWRSALIQRNALAGRMRQGENFILFGEGTSSNGLGVLPIKTSLLSVAEPWILDCPVAVQPVTLIYARLADGMPIGPDQLRSLRLALRCGVPAASVGCAAVGRGRDPGRRGRSRAVLVGAEPQVAGPRAAGPSERGPRPGPAASRRHGNRLRDRGPDRTGSAEPRTRKRRPSPPFQIGPACVGLRLVIHPS